MPASTCSTCGTRFESTVAGAPCPTCVLGSAMQSQDLRDEYFTADGRARVGYDSSGLEIAQIGPFFIDELIGKGGMGVVWRARQEFPVTREIALKVIREVGDDQQTVERFEAERRTLAQMAHPNIVRLFEAGETETGLPFFVMELVVGLSLTDYCDSRCLTISERVELFLQVVRGVQHAHQRGVIHRDLKPSNIIVNAGDGQTAAPKLIDFGIAKTMLNNWSEQTLLTLDGQILGTPEYMSPEQADGQTVDIRSDIFGLGAILYELLVGCPPLSREFAACAGGGIEPLLRLIREHDPLRPSLQVETEASGAQTAAADSRQVSPDRWRKLLADELDWIVLRCLAKDPMRRYESTDGLADDLQRWLDGEPVHARPPSRIYRVKKFAGRHRLLLSSLVTVFAALAVATALSLFWAVKATAAQTLAEARLAQADAVPDFLFSAFRQADPARGGADMLALDVLRQAEEQVAEEFADQPLIRARIQKSIGLTYRSLGRKDLAATVLGSALESSRSAEGNAAETERLSFLVSGMERGSGGAEDVITLGRETFLRRQQEHGEDASQTHEARLDYCRNLLEAAYWNESRKSGYLELVESTLGEVLNDVERFPSANIRAYQAVAAQLAAGRGDHETALAFWERDVTQLFSKGQGETAARFWRCRFLIAALRRTGNPEDGMAAAEALLIHCRNFYGMHHPNTVQAAYRMATVYAEFGKFESALLVCRLPTASDKTVREVFEKPLKELSEWSAGLQITETQRARVDKLIGAVINAGAEFPSADSADEIFAELPPEEQFWLGELACQTGKIQIGLRLCREAYRQTVASRGENHSITLSRGMRLALHCMTTGRLDEAQALLTAPLGSPEITWRHGDLLDIALQLAELRLEKREDLDACLALVSGVVDAQSRSVDQSSKRLDRSFQIVRELSQLPAHGCDPDEMASTFENLRSAHEALPGADHNKVYFVRLSQINSLAANGAAEHALELIASDREKIPANEPNLVFWDIAQARTLNVLGRRSEAHRILESLWQKCKPSEAEPDQRSQTLKTAAIACCGLRAAVYAGEERRKDVEIWTARAVEMRSLLKQ